MMDTLKLLVPCLLNLVYKDQNPYEESKKSSRKSTASKQNRHGDIVTERQSNFRDKLLRELKYLDLPDSSSSNRSANTMLKCMVSGEEGGMLSGQRISYPQ